MAFDKAPFNEDSYMEKEFLSIKDKYKIDVVVETGTYHGVTTEWFAKNFSLVHTTEINDEYYETAMNRFKSSGCIKNIVAWKGDSSSLIQNIISQIDNSGKKAAFFLDAHWYKNPLLDELSSIARLKYTPSVICIHDMMNPNDPTMGYDQYPEQGISYTFEWVKPYIDSIYGDGEYLYYFNEKADGARRGALFITPKTKTMSNEDDGEEV